MITKFTLRVSLCFCTVLYVLFFQVNRSPRAFLVLALRLKRAASTFFWHIFHNLKIRTTMQYRKKAHTLSPRKKTNPMVSELINQMGWGGFSTMPEWWPSGSWAEGLTLAESRKPTSGFFLALLKSPVTMFCGRLLPAVFEKQLQRPCQHTLPLGVTFPELPAAECDATSTSPLSAGPQISAPGLPRGQSCWTCWRWGSPAGWWQGPIDLCVTGGRVAPVMETWVRWKRTAGRTDWSVFSSEIFYQCFSRAPIRDCDLLCD